MSHIFSLIKKDLLLELRQQYSFYGLLLYGAATLFLLFMAIESPEAHVWNGLFWITQLFICINAVAKAFLQESRGRMLYYFTLNHPTHFILAKLFYNGILMLVMSAISLLFFLVLMGNPIDKMGAFIGMVFLGGFSLSLVFGFLAAIAARAQQNAAVMAILGFPVIIPQVVLLMRLSSTAFSPLVNVPVSTILLLLALDALVILLAVILFPFLWKD
ncbi:MAG: cytochrome C biogenesis protein [Bacteroidetes bacterium]|nr:cytochrome C biogenesis protein [Bacteroidota bacterium]